MLAFEREVVAALQDTAAADTRSAVARWVDESLRDMPQHLRAGVAAESTLLGAVGRLTGPRALVGWLGRTRVGPLRQYHRLFRSLVLFAELELTGDRLGAGQVGRASASEPGGDGFGAQPRRVTAPGGSDRRGGAPG